MAWKISITKKELETARKDPTTAAPLIDRKIAEVEAKKADRTQISGSLQDLLTTVAEHGPDLVVIPAKIQPQWAVATLSAWRGSGLSLPDIVELIAHVKTWATRPIGMTALLAKGQEWLARARMEKRQMVLPAVNLDAPVLPDGGPFEL